MLNSLSIATALSTTVAALTVFSGAAHAQPTDDDLGSTASLTALFPTVRQLPAPAFLQPGVRVSYSTGSATGNGGPAGGGIIQYDVVSRDAVQVLAHQHSYSNDGAGYTPLSVAPVRGYPGIGPFWIQPSVLAGAEAFGSATLTVTRYAKTLGNGQTITVVRFQTETINGRVVTEFDAATGLLVFDSLSSGASASQVVMLDVRQLQIPWGPGRAPNWVRPGATLAYSGVKATAIPGAGTVTQQMDMTAVTQQAGARWSIMTSESRLDGAITGTGAAVTGQAQLLGAYWVPVSSVGVPLTAAGVRVDVDPVTAAEIYLGLGDGGALVLQQITPTSRTTFAYNPTLGVLDRVTQELTSVVTSSTIDLVRTGGDDGLNALNQQAPLPEDPGAAGGAGGGGGGGGGGCAGATHETGLASCLWLLLGLLWVARSRATTRGSGGPRRGHRCR